MSDPIIINGGQDITVEVEPNPSADLGIVVMGGKKGETGDDAPDVQIQYSSDNSSFHDTFADGDLYIRFSTNGGDTWTSGFKFIGDDGTDGTNGTLGENPILGADLDANNYDLLDVKTMSFNGVYDNGNSGTTKTIDLSAGQHQKITLTGNCTVTWSNPTVGVHTLKVIQDATGSRTLTLPSGKWVGGSAYTPTSDASAEDLISIYYDGSAYYYSVVGLDFS
jgi:hypothetical protein